MSARTEPAVTHDVVAVGIGPFNLGLACLVEPIEELNCVFLERQPSFDWHPGMLLESATLQTPFLADLVTLADPTSAFSFLNYAKQAGYLYSFYIRESFHPLRSEYNDYCRWAAARLMSLRFGRDVQSITYDVDEAAYVIHVAVANGKRETYRARHLVLGTGTSPYLPAACDGLGDDAIHSSQYLFAKPDLQTRSNIMVVGGGQSAAEIFYDLLQDIDDRRYALTWITRSMRFFPLEYTKLTLEMTSPEYVEYFHGLSPSVREELVASQGPLFKGIDSELIDDIFRLLYRKHRQGGPMTRLLTNTELTDARPDETEGRFILDLRHVEQDREFTLSTEALILATGYRHEVPAFLAPIADRIAWDERGRFAVRRDYSIDLDGRTIFVQNAELHTHGFVAPDLGMAAYRSSCIIRALLGREQYPIERSIAFQEFGAPGPAPPPPSAVTVFADTGRGL